MYYRKDRRIYISFTARVLRLWRKGRFVPGSFWHLLPILVLALGVVLIVLARGKLRSWKGDRQFRFIFAFIMLVAEMSYFRRLLYVGDETGANSLMIKLPLHICQWGLYCAAFAMMMKSDTLLGINFWKWVYTVHRNKAGEEACREAGG